MRFTINNKDYSLSIYWTTTTLRQATEIAAIPTDEGIIDSVLVGEEFELGTKEFDYIIQVVAILSDCPIEVLRNTEPFYINVLFTYVKRLINELYHLDIESYKPRAIGSISFKGKIYNIPASINVDNDIIVAYKEPAKNITEAANLMMQLNNMKYEGIGVMKYICALYLKENDGEVYNDDKVKERAELFVDLPMSIVWDVFFYTYYSLNSSLIDTLIYLKKRKLSKVELIRLEILVILIGFIQWLKQVWQVQSKRWKRCLFGS